MKHMGQKIVRAEVVDVSKDRASSRHSMIDESELTETVTTSTKPEEVQTRQNPRMENEK